MELNTPNGMLFYEETGSGQPLILLHFCLSFCDQIRICSKKHCRSPRTKNGTHRFQHFVCVFHFSDPFFCFFCRAQSS